MRDTQNESCPSQAVGTFLVTKLCTSASCPEQPDLTRGWIAHAQSCHRKIQWEGSFKLPVK